MKILVMFRVVELWSVCYFWHKHFDSNVGESFMNEIIMFPLRLFYNWPQISSKKNIKNGQNVIFQIY